MDASCYASDLTDAEWALLEPLIPRSHPAGRRQTYPLRRIADAIFYLLRIPVKPDAYSKVKPDTHSDFIPDSVPI